MFVVRATAGAAASLSITATIVIISVAGFRVWIAEVDAILAIYSVFFAGIVWLASPRQSANHLLPIMATSALMVALYQIAFVSTTLWLTDHTVLMGDIVPAQLPSVVAWILFFSAWLVVPAMMMPATFGLFLFPDGRFPSPRWKPVGLFAVIALVWTSLATMWTYRPSNTGEAFHSPLVSTGFVALLALSLVSLGSLIVGFRTSHGTRRQQFKWVLLGASVFVLLFFVPGILFSERTDLGAAESVLAIAGGLIFMAAYGFAIARYRLFDINVVIRRTITYAIVVALLAGFYVSVVFLLQELLFSTSSSWVVAGTTLGVAALFHPLRSRVQAAVDRRFNRSHYDPVQLADELSSHLTSELDVTQIQDELIQAATFALEPSAIGVWTKTEQREQRVPD